MPDATPDPRLSILFETEQRVAVDQGGVAHPLSPLTDPGVSWVSASRTNVGWEECGGICAPEIFNKSLSPSCPGSQGPQISTDQWSWGKATHLDPQGPGVKSGEAPSFSPPYLHAPRVSNGMGTPQGSGASWAWAQSDCVEPSQPSSPWPYPGLWT